MRSIVWGKSQRDLSHPWPLPPFCHPLTSDFDVRTMIEKQLVGWGGGMGRRGGECCLIRETTTKFQLVYQSAKEREGKEGRTEERGRGEEEIQGRIKWAGCEKRSSSWSLFRKGPPLSCWVLLSSCPPGTMLVEQLPPHTSPKTPPHPMCPQLPSMYWCYADSLDPRPQHMEARPRGLLSSVLHSWGSVGMGSGASCNHMLTSVDPKLETCALIYFECFSFQSCVNSLFGVWGLWLNMQPVWQWPAHHLL